MGIEKRKNFETAVVAVRSYDIKLILESLNAEPLFLKIMQSVAWLLF